MKFLGYLLDLFYPNLCLNCSESLMEGETGLCLKCVTDLPTTNFQDKEHNLVEQRFWGKVRVEKATSFLYFRKGSVTQTILHDLKYKNNKSIGHFIGQLAGLELIKSPHFCNIDAIVPVPLFFKKELIRGYNQSKIICDGLSEILEKPIITKNLIRIKSGETQTKKTVYERYKNIQNSFTIENEKEFEGKHILLVDDVITTGSTLESCVLLFNQIKDTKVSIFSIAIATD